MGNAPRLVMVFDRSMKTLIGQVLLWGQVEHGADDWELAFHQHLETHYTLCEPVLTFYQQNNLL
nr:LOW QUALITY PROTEIN: adenylate kinase isoenzyme 1-like [Saimiri boliviensis boliviensis]